MKTTRQSDTDEEMALASANAEEESRWLRAIANGDRTSFAKLHERFEAVLFSTIYKVIGNYEDTQDVLQDVFAQIWKKAQLFDVAKGKPLTWVTTMARNRAIDHYRSKMRRSKLGEKYTDHVTVIGDSSMVDTSEDVGRNETAQILQSAVLELTPDQREAIEMAYFGGLTQIEVAERTGLPLGTVKGRIRRGIQCLERKVRSKV